MKQEQKTKGETREDLSQEDTTRDKMSKNNKRKDWTR